MAGKNYKVQKQAKEQQRLSVFQPAFRWGGNNASSSGSSSKGEPKKNDRLEPNRNDKLVVKKNERADQPRRNDNRLAVKEDPDVKMARDAKRMTTFQPVFGSLFSSKSSKGKQPEPAQPTHAQRPLANGPPSQQQSRNQAFDSARHGAASSASGSSKGGRTGPGLQNGALRIDTQDTRGSNSRRNEAASSSSGRNGRGGLAPVPEDYSPRPRSPLQRNPAFAIPEDESRPLGISNAFGTGGRGKDKAKQVSNVSANSTSYSSSGNMQDRNTSFAPVNSRGNGREESPFHKQKAIGVDTEYNPAAKRERMGIGFQRDDLSAANQQRLGDSPKRRPAVSNLEPEMDLRRQQRSGGRARDDEKLSQQPVVRNQNVPQLVITDASGLSSSGASVRPDRPSKGQQGISASTSKTTPGQKLESVRESEELSGVERATGQPPSTFDGTGRPHSRSPLDHVPATLFSKANQDPREVSPGTSQKDPKGAALSKRVLPQEAVSKPNLSVFPREQPQAQQHVLTAGPETSKSQAFEPLRPALGQKEVEKSSRVSDTNIYEIKDTADIMKHKNRQLREMVAGTGETVHTDAPASRHMAQKAPSEVLKPSAMYATQADTSKPAANSSRGPVDTAKSFDPLGQMTASSERVPTGRPVQQAEVTLDSGKSSTNRDFGRTSASRAAEPAQPHEAAQDSNTVPLALKPAQGLADQFSELHPKKSEGSRTGWASRYFESSHNDNSDYKAPRVERQPGVGKKIASTTVVHGLPDDQNSLSSEATRRDGADAGALNFKQRVQESIRVGKESSILKPSESRFLGSKKQEASPSLPWQASQPLAGDSKAPQINAMTKTSQQTDLPATSGKTSKGWKAYTIGKVSTEPNAQMVTSKAPSDADIFPSNKSDTPERPGNPQDELFLGVSGSALRPGPAVDSLPPPKSTQPLPSTDRRLKQKALREINGSLSETKTDRLDLSSTRKPAEALRLNSAEQDPRENIPAIADMSVNSDAASPSTVQNEAPVVRVVSRIIERPREIEIQKPLRQGKTKQSSSFDDQSRSDAPEKPEPAQSRNLGQVEGKRVNSLPGHKVEHRQMTGPSAYLETRRGDKTRDQNRQSEKSEAQKPSSMSMEDEWPRPVLTPTRILDTGAADPDKSSASGGRAVNVSGDTNSDPLETSQKTGLFGKWVGRAKRDKIPERSDQPRINEWLLTTETNTEAAPALEPVFGAQKLTPREVPEIGAQSVQSGKYTRDNMGIPSISAVEPPSERLSETSDIQKSSFTGVPSRRAKKGTSPLPHYSSQSNVDDAPVPLDVDARKPAHVFEAESKSHEGLGLRFPLTAEKQPPANDRLTDRAMPNTDRVGSSDVTSPDLPSQEDFFKQMRQSVMFRNAELAEKTDVPESTDTTTKRKSRRNRNFSISGLQPARGGVVPEIPTLNNSEHRPAAGSIDENPSRDLPHMAPSDSWPRQASLEALQTPKLSDIISGDHLDINSSRASSREQQQPNSTATTFERSFASDPSLLTTSRGSISGMPVRKVTAARVAESGRISLHPAPSHAEIFRRPSFDDQEVSIQPVTTHDVPPPATRADPKVQGFFDGLFKSKEADDFTLDFKDSSLGKDGVTRDDPGFHIARGTTAMEALPASTQSAGVIPDVRTLSEVSFPPSKQLHEADSKPTELLFVDTPPPDSMLEFSARKVERDALAETPDMSEQRRVGHFDSGLIHPGFDSSPITLSPSPGQKSPANALKSAMTDEPGYSQRSLTSEDEYPPQYVGVQNQETARSAKFPSYAPSVHEQGRQSLTSPAGVDRAPASVNFDSRLPSLREPTNTFETGSISAQTAASRDEPDHSQPSQERQQILPSLYPSTSAGITASPQESDPDLSDHILSLYDGSDFVAPDHHSTDGFLGIPPASSNGRGTWSSMNTTHTRSSRELHTPTEDHRSSLSSIETMPVETFKAPSGRWPDSPTPPDTTTRSPPPALTPTTSHRELSDHVNVETENMEPAPLRTGGISDRLRKLIGNQDSAEPATGPQAHPVVASHVQAYSPEPSCDRTMPHNDRGMEPLLSGMPLNFADTWKDTADENRVPSSALPDSNEDQLASPSHDISDAPDSDLSDPIMLNEAIGSHGLANPPSPSVIQDVNVGQPNSRTPGYSSPMHESRTGPTHLPQVWTPSQGSQLDSSCSADGVCSSLLTPRAVEGIHSTQEYLYPRPDESTSPLDEAHEKRWDGSEEAHETVGSPLHSVDAFVTVTSPKGPTTEGENAYDETLRKSNSSSARHDESDSPADSLDPHKDEIGASDVRVSDFDLTSHVLELDTFHPNDSPLPHESNHRASGVIEPHQDADPVSPRTSHMDDWLSRETVKASPMVTNESFESHIPASEPLNNGTMQIGSHSPVGIDSHHDEGATMLGDAESDFNTPARGVDDHDALDGHSAVEPNDDPRDDSRDTADDDLSVDDYQHNSQSSGSIGKNGIETRDYENPEGRLDNLDDGRSPVDDFQEDLGDLGDAKTDSHAADDHQSGAGGFPVSDYEGTSGDLDDTRSGSYPTDDVPRNDGGFEETQRYPQDIIQGDLEEVDKAAINHYPADDLTSNEDGFEKSGVHSYPADDLQSHPGAFDDASMDRHPVDDSPNDAAGLDDTSFDNHGAEDFDNNAPPLDTMDQDPPPPYDQDQDLAYQASHANGSDPINDDTPYEEPALSAHGGEKDMEFGLDHDQQEGSFGDEHIADDGLLDDEPGLDDHGEGMNFPDDKKGDFDDMGGEETWNSPAEDADLDRGLDGNVDDLGGEPSWGVDKEQPADFAEGGIGDDGEPFDAVYQTDGAQGLGEAEAYPMEQPGDFPMGGEAEEYLMGGEGAYAEDPMEAGESFPTDADDELPIDEMYGGEERSIDPMEAEEELPIMEDEALQLMDGEDEYPIDGEDECPIDGEGEYPMDGDEYPREEEDEHSGEGDDIEELDRNIDDFNGDDQLRDGLSDHGSLLEDDHESHFDDGFVEERSVGDEDIGDDLADEDRGSDYGGPSDEELDSAFEHEDEGFPPSDINDHEIEDDSMSLAGEEDEDDDDDDDEECNTDSLSEGNVPSIPASPTSTEHDRELASPTSAGDHDYEDDEAEDSIFNELAAQEEESADLENADPIRLSCIYMQDVGLLSSPSTPTIPQEVDIPEQAENEEDEPREPIRFSTLYRQSIDWSQALDPSMWEDVDDDTMPEESKEQIFTAPVLPPVPESAKGGSHEDLRMLEADHELSTPIAASPLSPRPLETPPPDSDHDYDDHGDAETHYLLDQPDELYKGVDDNPRQRYPTSPRLQPTPPPDHDRAPAGRGSQDDQRDSRGPRTFDEMNLPRRVISPPNEGDGEDDPGQGSSSGQMMPAADSRRSISQRFSGWWSGGGGGGSSGQVRARLPPLPTQYDSRYGEPGSPV